MTKQTIPLFLGVIVSVMIIAYLNQLFIVDICTEKGGNFSYHTGQCILNNGDVYIANTTKYVIGLFFVLAIAITFVVSTFIKKRLSL